MSGSNLLNIGSQALTANTTALNVVGQNIANVDTDGYTRQDVTMVSREGVNGVVVTDINRIADEFLQSQIYSQTSSYYNLSSYQALSSQLDNLLASDATSISTALDNYFAAMQTALDDPSNLSNRELLLSESNALVQSFQTLDAQLARQNDAINTEISDSVAAINSLSSNLAAVNDSIRLVKAAGSVSNELLDQRDQILEQLAGHINFTTDIQSDGQVNVFIGQGEPLIVGQTAYRMSAEPNPKDITETNVYLSIGGQKTDLTTQISGGVLGGVIDYRESILNNTRDELGLLALTFSDSMNELQSLGLDLDGEFGTPMFTDINSSNARNNRLWASADNSATLRNSSVTLTDISEVQASEYTLKFTARDEVTVTREDGKSWTFSPVENGEVDIELDGMNISMKVDLTRSPVGDTYTIQPTRYGTDNMGLLINDGSKLAFAEPVSIAQSPSNESDATLETSVSSTKFQDLLSAYTGSTDAMPLNVSFEEDGAGGLTYTIADANGVEILSAQPYVPDTALLSPDMDLNGDSNPDNLGLTIDVNGIPEAGDSFTLAFNESGVSDNRNGLAMAELQYTKLVDNASYQDFYAVMVQQVGSKTAVAQTNAEAAKSLLDTNIDQRSSISGVSLDEEAANLVKFQQAYAASSQLISTWQEMFDTLLSSVRA